ncbi:Hypothetical protein POVR1_LOCUS124 [uncultured virus]|nr:Hypothetical protein POVR1_LOCUS124 [uncultured virus]
MEMVDPTKDDLAFGPWIFSVISFGLTLVVTVISWGYYQKPIIILYYAVVATSSVNSFFEIISYLVIYRRYPSYIERQKQKNDYTPL